MEAITFRYQNVFLKINQQKILILLSLFLLRTPIHKKKKKWLSRKLFTFLISLRCTKKKKKKTYTNEVILMIINPTHSLLLRGILFI